MNGPKILLLGHHGYLGSYLYPKLNSYNISINPSDNDFDFVINCIGKPDLEFCQKNPLISEESNFNVVKKIKRDFPNSKIIHFSSYYVYDDFGFCCEKSMTTDLYWYTKHKLQSEKEIENGVVFRLGKLFGHPDIKKQNKLTEFIVNTDDLILDRVVFNPTSLEQVLTAVEFEIKNRCLCGIFNLSNEGTVSHVDYGYFIIKVLKKVKKIKEIEKMNRIFKNYGKFAMSVEKICKFIKLNKWESDLLKYLEILK